MKAQKQPMPRRSTISRLVCVYEWSPTAILSQRALATSPPNTDAGTASGGDGEGNASGENDDLEREAEPEANMHASVGAHGGGWQTHLKVPHYFALKYMSI